MINKQKYLELKEIYKNSRITLSDIPELEKHIDECIIFYLKKHSSEIYLDIHVVKKISDKYNISINTYSNSNLSLINIIKEYYIDYNIFYNKHFEGSMLMTIKDE